jgi:hypothetical protein
MIKEIFLGKDDTGEDWKEIPEEDESFNYQ